MLEYLYYKVKYTHGHTIKYIYGFIYIRKDKYTEKIYI